MDRVETAMRMTLLRGHRVLLRMFSRNTIELDVEHVVEHGGQLPCTCLSEGVMLFCE